MLESKKGKDEKFEPHMMYDPKTGKGKMAKVEKDHKDLAKKGWTHDKPKKVKEASTKKAVCKECGNPSYTTLDEEKQKGVDGKVCWKGYKRMGTKKKGGKTVDNCVKM